MRSLYLLIIFILFSSYQGITKSSHNTANKIDSNARANSLIKLWEQSNSKDRNANDPYTINVWEKLLSKEYEIAIRNKDDEMQFRLSIPLSYTYHSETKFSKGKPLLENLLTNKKRLSQKDYELVLIKLEEEYRAFNDLENAIKIRKERISNHFINNYWEIYKDCGLYEAAKKDLFQFVTIPPNHSLKRLSYYFLLGDLYFQMKSYDSALTIYNKGLREAKESIEYNKAYQIYKAEELKYWEACFNGYIIKCNIEKGDYSNAVPTLLYDIAHSYQNTDNIITKMLVLTKCYLHDGHFDDAKRTIENVKKMLLGKLNNSLQLELILLESNYFNAMQKNDSALYFYKLYNNYRDELYINTQKNQSILLLGQLEITNRRNELIESKQSLNDSIKENSNQKMMLVILLFSLFISILFGTFFYRNNLLKSKSKDQIEAKNVLINEHLVKMEAQSNHNEVLLKELHHRVKNNLQVMYSLLNLQKRRNGDTDTVETLSSIQNRIQTMALVHQTLYTSGNFELVEVASYIRTLANHLESIYKIDKKKISVKFVIDELLKLPIETVVAIGLIVNEAVSNAFKYAFKNKSTGKLTIKIIETESEISIIIEDNGNGFLDTPKKENSLGMRLIDLMCSQLKANHTIEMNKGVRHLINFNK